jgi:hypothetical protein
LDAYLAECESQGYLIETRTGTQAVIVGRSRLPFAIPWRPARRFVVSVDEHGVVTSAAAEPVRW